jgi:hypothetical protein
MDALLAKALRELRSAAAEVENFFVPKAKHPDLGVLPIMTEGQQLVLAALRHGIEEANDAIDAYDRERRDQKEDLSDEVFSR